MCQLCLLQSRLLTDKGGDCVVPRWIFSSSAGLPSLQVREVLLVVES